jgi:hypothetical protein
VAQVPLQVGVQYRVRRWKVKCWVVDDNRLTQQFIRQLTRQERPFRVFRQTFRTELLVRTSSKKSSTQNFNTTELTNVSNRSPQVLSASLQQACLRVAYWLRQSLAGPSLIRQKRLERQRTRKVIHTRSSDQMY